MAKYNVLVTRKRIITEQTLVTVDIGESNYDRFDIEEEAIEIARKKADLLEWEFSEKEIRNYDDAELKEDN
jgi:hypothetical protein